MSTPSHPDLVLGTAGHIDHGKSSLVLASPEPIPTACPKRRSAASPSSWASRSFPCPEA